MVLSRVRALKGLFLCEPLSMDKTFKVDEDLIAFERRMEYLQDSVLSKMDLSDAPLDDEDSESEEDVGDSSMDCETSISTEENSTADSEATPGVDDKTTEIQANNFDTDDFWDKQFTSTTDNDNSGNAETKSVTGSARSSYTSEHESKRRRIIRSNTDDVNPIWYGLGEHIGVPEDMDHFRLNNLESVADNEVSDEFQNRVFSDYPLNDTYTRRGNYISVLRFCCIKEINSRADRINMNERRRVWSSIRSDRDLRTSIVQRAKAMYSKEFCSANQNPSE